MSETPDLGDLHIIRKLKLNGEEDGKFGLSVLSLVLFIESVFSGDNRHCLFGFQSARFACYLC